MSEQTPFQFSDRRNDERPRSDRRRSGWRDFRYAYPGVVATMTVALFTLAVFAGVLVFKRASYASEVERLRATMTDVERQKADIVMANEERRYEVMLALLRRQASLDANLHLAVAVDSGVLYLERDGAVLRRVAAEVGAERTVGIAPDTVHLAAPRGSRTVEQILEADSEWDVPAWLWAERATAQPANAKVRGALGSGALLLTGGTIIYAQPDEGPLAAPDFVLPGSVRVSAADLTAMKANLKPGMTVYFY